MLFWLGSAERNKQIKSIFCLEDFTVQSGAITYSCKNLSPRTWAGKEDAHNYEPGTYHGLFLLRTPNSAESGETSHFLPVSWLTTYLSRIMTAYEGGWFVSEKDYDGIQ